MSEAGDVYALGVIMWEMAHLQRIWRRMTLAAVVSRLRRRKTVKCTADMPELFVVRALLKTLLVPRAASGQSSMSFAG